MGLEKTILDEQKILAYADAAIEIGDRAKKITKESGCNILIPSRGSYPLWNLAKKYLCLENNPKLYPQLENIDMPIDGLLPADSYERSASGILVDPRKLNYEIIVPFSAFDRDPSLNKKIRSFWVQVYDKIQNNQLNDPEVEFYKHVLKEAAGFLSDEEDINEKIEFVRNINKIPSGMEGIRKFIPEYLDKRKTLLIDTVMSGYCLRDILGAIQSRDMDFEAIIAIDNNGKDLKSQNKVFIENDARIHRVYVPEIITEDRGPALLGVTTLVYPSIIEAVSKSKEFADYGLDFAAAGCWMTIPYLKKKTRAVVDSTLRNPAMKTQKLFLQALAMRLEDYDAPVEGLDMSQIRKDFDNERKTLIEVLEKDDLMDCDKTLEHYKDFLFEITGTKDITATSSHVIRVNYSPERVKRIMIDFKKKLDSRNR